MSFLSEIALSVYYLGGNSLQDVRLSTYLLKVSGMVTEGYGITGIGEYNLRNKGIYVCIIFTCHHLRTAVSKLPINGVY